MILSADDSVFQRLTKWVNAYRGTRGVTGKTGRREVEAAARAENAVGFAAVGRDSGRAAHGLTGPSDLAEASARQSLLPQSVMYMCGFLPLPFSTSLISPSLRKVQRGWLISCAVTEMGMVLLMNSTSALAVKNPRLRCSVCRTASIAPSLRSRFTFPSRVFADTVTGGARRGLVWDARSAAEAAALSERSTELILLRHLALHALSSASRRLLSFVLRFIRAFWSICST